MFHNDKQSHVYNHAKT
uniref:Uncharacterized protein n=1 Tax=Arundo donax TaxID=35708 RepID=A0A0A9HWX8_ARUDO